MLKYSACNPAVMALNDYFYGDPLQKKSSENLGNIIKYSVVTELLEEKEKLPLNKQAYLRGFVKTLNKVGVVDKRAVDALVKVAFFIELSFEESLEKGAAAKSDNTPWYSNLSKYPGYIKDWAIKNPGITTGLMGLLTGGATGLATGNWGAGLGAGMAGAGATALGLNYADSDWSQGMGADLYNKAKGLF